VDTGFPKRSCSNNKLKRNFRFSAYKSSLSETSGDGGQNRRGGQPPLPKRAVQQRLYLSWAGILLLSIALFDVLLQIYLLRFYLLKLHFARRQARKPRPLVAKMQHFARLIEELRMRIVVSPASGFPKFDEVLLPTLNQSEPAAGDTVVRTLLPFRHEESQAAVESALVDNQRALPIRATKMNALPN
jgi:hypothetical protein